MSGDVNNFPDAETVVNRMLAACEHDGTVARVRFGDGPLQLMPGPTLLAYLERELREPLLIESVVAVAGDLIRADEAGGDARYMA